MMRSGIEFVGILKLCHLMRGCASSSLRLSIALIGLPPDCLDFDEETDQIVGDVTQRKAPYFMYYGPVTRPSNFGPEYMITCV